MKHVEDIIQEGEYHEQEHQRVDDVLTDDGHDNVAVGTGKPFLACIELHLHTKRVG